MPFSVRPRHEVDPSARSEEILHAANGEAVQLEQPSMWLRR